MATISEEIKNIRETCWLKNIPEYLENLDDEDVILLALARLSIHIEEDRDDIFEDIHCDEEGD